MKWWHVVAVAVVAMALLKCESGRRAAAVAALAANSDTCDPGTYAGDLEKSGSKIVSCIFEIHDAQAGLRDVWLLSASARAELDRKMDARKMKFQELNKEESRRRRGKLPR